VTPRQGLSRSTEWVLRRQALREARAAVPARGQRRDRAVCQARLLLEVARRVAEPVERLPPGARPPVRLTLYRQAAYWALVAGRSDDGDAPPDLGAAWAAADPEHLRRAAHGDPNQEAVKRVLVDRSEPDPLDVADEDTSRARDFTQTLLADLDGPKRRVDRVLFQRWWRVTLVLLLLAIAVMGARKLTLGPNMLADKPMRVSSSWSGCAQDAGCQSVMFHTEHELNPWVEFDLGERKTFRRLEVTNRADCCSERAIPLVAEISDDRASWTTIGRRETEFSTWTLTFPPKTARYIKLRVARMSTFHLKDVALR
jgi:hypothetical protein